MKRFLSYLLAAALLLAGCTGPGVQETTPPALSTDPTGTQPAATQPPETDPPVTEAPPTEPPAEEPTEEPTDAPVRLTLPQRILKGMTVEEKVGQLFLARCPDWNALEDVENYHLGGYVLFSVDLEGLSRDQVIAKTAAYQAAAKIPMFIAVDEEGGIVCRVSEQPLLRDSRFPSPRNLYREGGMALIRSTEAEKAELLSSLGINVNLSPVCDITTDPDSFMYSRSLGQSPEITGQFVTEALAIMSQYGISGVMKHFPGYGNNTDTHVGIAVDNRSLEELESADLVPFAAGIAYGGQAIMVSHTFVNCLDPELPASLSPKVVAYLREEMGFRGVITTDDLVMQAITDLYGAGESAVLAIQAGIDILCCSEYRIQYQAVLEAVQDGRISQEILDQAVLRILNWKMQMGLLDQFI